MSTITKRNAVSASAFSESNQSRKLSNEDEQTRDGARSEINELPAAVLAVVGRDRVRVPIHDIR